VNFLSYIYAFLVGLIVAVIGTILRLPSLFVLVLVYVIIAYMIAFPLIRMYFGKGDVKNTERFLLKNKRKPFHQLYYGIANGIEEDVDEATRKINKGFLSKTKKNQYQLIYAAFHEQPEEMEKLLKGIRKSALTLYYQTIHSVMINDLGAARRLIEQNPKLWMREALTAEVLVKENRKEAAIDHAKNAISKTRGVQRYILIRTWEREWGMNFN
jgi:hypothetical protein